MDNLNHKLFINHYFLEYYFSNYIGEMMSLTPVFSDHNSNIVYIIETYLDFQGGISVDIHVKVCAQDEVPILIQDHLANRPGRPWRSGDQGTFEERLNESLRLAVGGRVVGNHPQQE